MAATASSSSARTRQFSSVMWDAILAANAAGKNWDDQHTDVLMTFTDEEGKEVPVKGRIGVAFLQIPPAYTDFGEWIREHNIDDHKDYVTISHNYENRYELDLQLECEKAAQRVFANAGIDLNIRSYAL